LLVDRWRSEANNVGRHIYNATTGTIFTTQGKLAVERKAVTESATKQKNKNKTILKQF
jgi:hypothetical protein